MCTHVFTRKTKMTDVVRDSNKHNYHDNDKFVLSTQQSAIIESITNTDLDVLKDIINTATKEEQCIKEDILRYTTILFGKKYDLEKNLIVCVFFNQKKTKLFF